MDGWMNGMVHSTIVDTYLKGLMDGWDGMEWDGWMDEWDCASNN